MKMNKVMKIQQSVKTAHLAGGRALYVQLVGDLHVSASDIDVVRHVRSKMLKDKRRDPSMRIWRKEVYRQCIAEHHDNQETYRLVQGGRF